MYAVVANGIRAICKTQRQLDNIIAVYPYPKFVKVRNVEEGRAWIRQHLRGINTYMFERYGDTAMWGYASIKYKIGDNKIIYDIDTHRVGYIKVAEVKGMSVESRLDSMYVVIENVNLKDEIIIHHIIAIRRILKLLGNYIDVEIVVPDMSIYLALKKYSGANYIIRGAQHEIQQRLAGVSITVEGSSCVVKSEDEQGDVVLDDPVCYTE